MRKSLGAFLAVMTAFLLASCAAEEIPERQETETETMIYAEEEKTEPVTLVTVTKMPEATAADEAPEDGDSFDEEDDGSEMPEVIPSNEIWGDCPVKLVSPENDQRPFTVRKAGIKETLINPNGVPFCDFTAEYPVFSGGDEKAVSSINSCLKSFAEEQLEYKRKQAEESTEAYSGEEDDWLKNCIEQFGALETCELSFDTNLYGLSYDYYVNGNLLSVFFTDYYYGAGAAHGYTEPVPMVFDIRSGERVDFWSITEDRESLSLELYKAMCMLLDSSDIETYETYFIGGLAGYGDHEDPYARCVFMDNENGKAFLSGENAEYSLSVLDGCVCVYLAPYEYGSFSDGIRCVKVPAEKVIPYMNESGKELFEGFVSAKALPLNVIEYKGGRYFETEDVPAFRGSPEEPYVLAGGDYKFIKLFDTHSSLSFSFCENIDCKKLADIGGMNRLSFEGCLCLDLEALAKIKSLSSLDITDCGIEDISPLYDSSVIYIWGSGNTIPREQAETFMSENEERYISSDLIK